MDRISTIIAWLVIRRSFKEVSEWLEKLDVPVKLTAGGGRQPRL